MEMVSIGMEIQPTYVTLDRLLYGRLFRIPQYQRAYSWQSKQRKDLFDDIKSIRNNGDTRSHFMATVVGLRRGKQKIVTEEHQIIEVVDGQQRLCTLIILLKAISKALDRTIKIEEKIGKEIDSTLVKDDDATLLLLQTNHDSSNYFADYLRNGNSPSPKSATTSADQELLSCIVDCERFVSRWQQRNKSLTDLVDILKNRLTFVFHEIADEGLVYSVFEVLNSRGLPVSWVDRLKSSLMAIVFDSKIDNRMEIIEEVHSLWTEIYGIIGLRLGLSTESLRFAATLKSSQCPSRPLSEEDAVDLLVSSCNGKPKKVIEVTTWLKTVTEAVNRLLEDQRRSAVSRISQARLLATAVYLRSDLSDLEQKKILDCWEKVTFRIYGMYGKDARTSVGEYVRLAWNIANQKMRGDEIRAQLTIIGEEFPAKGAVDSLRKKDCYNGWQEELIYFFYRYEEYLSGKAGQKFDNAQWNKIWQGRPTDSIEHIFPQSQTESEWVHWLGNLLILPPKLNSSLGKKKPTAKRDSYINSGLLIAQDVASKLERDNWNKNSILKRENAILSWARREWKDCD